MGTDAQVSYALWLLDTLGYGAKKMTPKFKEIGAREDEIHGSVIAWLVPMHRTKCGNLIEGLKERLP